MKELIVSLLLSFLIAETAQGVVTKYKDGMNPINSLEQELRNLESGLE